MECQLASTDVSDVAEPTTEPGRVRKFDRPPPPHDWRWWVGGLGKTLIATGLLMFGFVAYQLWGTGIETARAQDRAGERVRGPPRRHDHHRCADDRRHRAGEHRAGRSPCRTPTTDVTAPDTVPVEAQTPVVEEGDPIARIEMPTIGVDNIVVAGVEQSDLKKGPGHYPETPLPGQLGNAAIAGHRTTYGQPFFDIDKLEVGDEIVVTTLDGRFVYRVTGQQIVSPSDYQVVATVDPTTATLTLTSCHPKWTARERIIITSELDTAASSGPAGEPVINYGRPIDETSDGTGDEIDPTNTVVDSVPADSVPADSVPTSEPAAADGSDDPSAGAQADAVNTGIADAFDDGWFSDPDANGQVALWGLLLAAVGVVSYLVSTKAKRDWVGLTVGIVPFVIVLYFFFQNVNRLLPPNL